MSKKLEDFRLVVAGICERPHMFVGRFDLELVAAFLDGYVAASDVEVQAIWGNFQRWTEARYGVFNSAWHWHHILLYSNHTQRAAAKALGMLFKELVEFGPLPDDLEWVHERIRERRGTGTFCPPNAEHPLEKPYPIGICEPET